MSCDKCERAAVVGMVYWYRWDVATIGILACKIHAKEMIDALNKIQKGDKNGEKRATKEKSQR